MPTSSRAVALELGQHLVVERQLVAADGAPVGRIEDEDHRLAAQTAQRHALAVRGGQIEFGRGVPTLADCGHGTLPDLRIPSYEYIASTPRANCRLSAAGSQYGMKSYSLTAVRGVVTELIVLPHRLPAIDDRMFKLLVNSTLALFASSRIVESFSS